MRSPLREEGPDLVRRCRSETVRRECSHRTGRRRRRNRRRGSDSSGGEFPPRPSLVGDQQEGLEEAGVPVAEEG